MGFKAFSYLLRSYSAKYSFQAYASWILALARVELATYGVQRRGAYRSTNLKRKTQTTEKLLFSVATRALSLWCLQEVNSRKLYS